MPMPDYSIVSGRIVAVGSLPHLASRAETALGDAGITDARLAADLAEYARLCRLTEAEADRIRKYCAQKSVEQDRTLCDHCAGHGSTSYQRQNCGTSEACYACERRPSRVV
jgi:hypothetical protein